MSCAIAKHTSRFKHKKYCLHGRAVFTQTTKVSFNESLKGACRKQLPKMADLLCLSVPVSVHFSVLMEQFVDASPFRSMRRK
jgi:hypothetical protein